MPRDFLSELNKHQRRAVETIDGPLLIVAGPGSGKTRLITYRIAYLIKFCGVAPWRIAAVTFTNKAAREMKERLASLVNQTASDVTVGTFHSFCAMTLRRDGLSIGLDSEFVIYDDADQVEMIKRSMRETDVDPNLFKPRSIQSAISNAKSQLLGAEGFAMRASNYFEEVVARAYERYEQLLARSGALDFDDLLLKTFQMLEQRPEVAKKYQERYVHFMIDEFQDTNMAQYAISSQFAKLHRNLCVVGDPDQSIYSWRNADIRNILSFQKDYPDAKLVALEENYRSTQTILDAADGLISSNSQRVEKELFTQNGKGVPIVVGEGYDEDEEARMVLREIDILTEDDESDCRKYKLGDIAVMYRVNAQSRALEDGCLRYGVPYQVVGGQKFYQRQEVKDLAAFLKLLVNPNDDVSFTRVVNLPNRGIGRRTIDELVRLARDSGVSMFDAVGFLSQDEKKPRVPTGQSFTARAVRALMDFRDLIQGLRQEADTLGLVALIDEVMDRTGYRTHLAESADKSEERLENIEEFKNATEDFRDLGAREALPALLERFSLVSDVDSMEERPEAITLITLHQAKGLEFPVVFIVGMEEGLLPHSRSMDEPSEIEEERRLLYVGVTRAKERLYLMRAFRRGFRGGSRGGIGPGVPSRFLLDIPRDLILQTKGGTDERGPDRLDRGLLGARRVTVTGKGLTSKVKPDPSDNVAGKRTAPRALKLSAGDGRGSRVTADSAHVYSAGDKVRHESFGVGIVMNCVPSGDDFEVTVVFDETHGIKRLLLGFAPLKKLR
ncbi:UvrD-helicase domain-containing protein [Dehalococcoidia bacterium]|nr:UvrD-helicase domain-containing protein [Dehalococcoidia bacterium]